mmetsp:Transcript_59785/g.129591  ORF Transcript_59785/g.129591 Transcript_59785/m.129591 type:complete len:204 (-) Transcript_59785:298-909(-)
MQRLAQLQLAHAVGLALEQPVPALAGRCLGEAEGHHMHVLEEKRVARAMLVHAVREYAVEHGRHAAARRHADRLLALVAQPEAHVGLAVGARQPDRYVHAVARLAPRPVLAQLRRAAPRAILEDVSLPPKLLVRHQPLVVRPLEQPPLAVLLLTLGHQLLRKRARITAGIVRLGFAVAMHPANAHLAEGHAACIADAVCWTWA